ncbi:hypothetical protein BGX28_000103 [Mortierella sp. GBA30]|nr:hypothetical protein BGX28_000103 [Mortierella sp. GBA30]
MVNSPTFLLASVAIMACSTSALVLDNPKSLSADDFENYTAADALSVEVLEEETSDKITSCPCRDENVTSERHNERTRSKKALNVSANLKSEQQLILDTHNKYRAKHQAPPLTWNDDAEQFGNDWIQQCVFDHSENGPYGENLSGGRETFVAAIDGWYDEVDMYDYNQPGYKKATGHFTQVVWKGTKSVGCAKKDCGGSMLYICEYDPPGNVDDSRSFRENVLLPNAD